MKNFAFLHRRVVYVLTATSLALCSCERSNDFEGMKKKDNKASMAAAEGLAQCVVGTTDGTAQQSISTSIPDGCLEAGKTEIMVGDSVVARDDGAGTLVPVAGADAVVSGEIDYTTGEITLIVDSKSDVGSEIRAACRDCTSTSTGTDSGATTGNTTTNNGTNPPAGNPDGTWVPPSVQPQMMTNDQAQINTPVLEHSCPAGWALSSIGLNFRGMTGYIEQNGNMWSRCFSYTGKPMPPYGAPIRELSCSSQNVCRLQCGSDEILVGVRIDYSQQASGRGSLVAKCANISSKYAVLSTRMIQSPYQESPSMDCAYEQGEAVAGVEVEWQKTVIQGNRDFSQGRLGIYCGKYRDL